MLLGYADESGELGVMKNEHDYFVFCIVLFKNRQMVQDCSVMIDMFRFISVSIKKNHLRNTTSFRKVAELTLELLNQKRINANIIMDKNPSLYKELRLQKKRYQIELHFSEKESRGNNLIQLADYVTALRARMLKYPAKKTAMEPYSAISTKIIAAIEL